MIIAAATGCYTGHIPVAPGTFGTVVAIPLCYFLSVLSPLTGLAFIGAFCVLAVWISTEAEKILEQKDSGKIVIDEMAGFLVTLYLIPFTVVSLVGGFVLFRLMDISKPYPIKRLESTLPGGWGVVGDDFLAGVYANGSYSDATSGP
ncbi:MAG: phosphatidylglycerophosphatase A [Deltaproteobacteria bacterium]|nr:phosphatidylglycerophosphatase A [Deltaproteobacteria bacterium]